MKKRRRQKYTGVQKFIVFCFFLIVAASVALTVWLVRLSMDWANRSEWLDSIPEEEVEIYTEDTPELPESEETAVPEENPEEEPEEDDSAGRVLEKQSDDWKLILVNKWNKVPRKYSVNLIELNNGHSIDERAYPDLQDMMDAARAEGLSPILCSSYRTSNQQRTLYERQVQKYLDKGWSQEEAEEEAGKWVAVPGTSEHQTGLAVDIVALSYQLLDRGQEDTAEQKWLMENSYKYGYILRYPTDKSDITGIHYEPWHYRYVGKDVAKEIYESGLCLEEYLMANN